MFVDAAGGGCNFPTYAVNTGDPRTNFWTKGITLSGSFVNVQITNNRIQETSVPSNRLGQITCVRDLSKAEGADTYFVDYIR